jgi:excisionase family DNA binding protein
LKPPPLGGGVFTVQFVCGHSGWTALEVICQLGGNSPAGQRMGDHRSTSTLIGPRGVFCVLEDHMSTTTLPSAERLAYSISEFCLLVGVSRSYFYALPDTAKPQMVKRGRRCLIPADAVKGWLRSDGIAEAA